MKIKKNEILKGVFQLVFATQYEMAATFLRFQEYYESPKFKGKAFTLETYMDWYATEYGNFTYYQDWSGFNIPSTALEPFYKGRFDPLSKKETSLLRLFRRTKRPFYIVGVLTEDDSPTSVALQHEIAHALFFVSPDYKKQVLGILRKHDTSKAEKGLRAMGYHHSVVQDELQAYLVAGADDGDVDFSQRILKLRKQMLPLFQKHRKSMEI